MVWQGPPEEAVQSNGRRSHERHNGEHQPHVEREQHADPNHGASAQDYEYEQQRQRDAERALPDPPREAEASTAADIPRPHYDEVATNASTPNEEPGSLKSPWEPLNVRRDRSATPEPALTLRDANLGAPISIPSTDTDQSAHNYGEPSVPRSAEQEPPSVVEHAIPPAAEQTVHAVPDQAVLTSPPNHVVHTIASPTSIEMPPRPSFFNTNSTAPTPTPGDGGFYTPLEGPSMTSLPESVPTSFQAEKRPAPQTVSSPTVPVPVGGKISAAAFRRAAKPRTSVDPEDPGSAISPVARKLPFPPGRAETPTGSGGGLPASPSRGERGVGVWFWTSAS